MVILVPVHCKLTGSQHKKIGRLVRGKDAVNHRGQGRGFAWLLLGQVTGGLGPTTASSVGNSSNSSVQGVFSSGDTLVDFWLTRLRHDFFYVWFDPVPSHSRKLEVQQSVLYCVYCFAQKPRLIGNLPRNECAFRDCVSTGALPSGSINVPTPPPREKPPATKITMNWCGNLTYNICTSFAYIGRQIVNKVAISL